MQDGFLKVMAATPEIRVADCEFNTEGIIGALQEAKRAGAKLLVLPELCITGYTCGDLFLQNVLTEAALTGLSRVREATVGRDTVVVFTLPFLKDNKLYNTAAVVQNGRILGLVPKTHLPNYSEFYEARHFVQGTGSISLSLARKCHLVQNYCFAVKIWKILSSAWKSVKISGSQVLLRVLWPVRARC